MGLQQALLPSELRGQVLQSTSVFLTHSIFFFFHLEVFLNKLQIS